MFSKSNNMESKYLFILGRNIELSIQEVFSYFKKENISISNYFLVKNGLLIQVNKKINSNIVNEFGGVISIGKIIAEGNLEDIKKEISTKTIYFKSKNNFTYVLWNFSDMISIEKIKEVLKIKFKEEKLKSTEKPLTGILEMQTGKNINIIGNKVDEQYFLFSKNSKFYFGNIIENYDYDALEKRDMNKPIRREDLAISPRLAKIMINLSEIKKGKLIDPFCGIGVILFEGLLKELEVTGIDMDSKAIEGAKENLKWGKFYKEKYNLIIDDSKKIKINEKFNALVSEPDLGEKLTKQVSENKANEILLKFEKLIISVLNNLKRNIDGKIVFTSPYIKTIRTNRKGCNIHNLLNQTGLKIAKGFPINEYRKNQIVGRQIFVLEK